MKHVCFCASPLCVSASSMRQGYFTQTYKNRWSRRQEKGKREKPLEKVVASKIEIWITTFPSHENRHDVRCNLQPVRLFSSSQLRLVNNETVPVNDIEPPDSHTTLDSPMKSRRRRSRERESPKSRVQFTFG